MKVIHYSMHCTVFTVLHCFRDIWLSLLPNHRIFVEVSIRSVFFPTVYRGEEKLHLNSCLCLGQLKIIKSNPSSHSVYSSFLTLCFFFFLIRFLFLLTLFSLYSLLSFFFSCIYIFLSFLLITLLFSLFLSFTPIFCK